MLQPQEGLGERLKHAAEDAVHRAEDALHKVEHEVEEVVHKVRLNASLSTQSSSWRCQSALPHWLCLERLGCRLPALSWRKSGQALPGTPMA